MQFGTSALLEDTQLVNAVGGWDYFLNITEQRSSVPQDSGTDLWGSSTLKVFKAGLWLEEHFQNFPRLTKRKNASWWTEQLVKVLNIETDFKEVLNLCVWWWFNNASEQQLFVCTETHSWRGKLITKHHDLKCNRENIQTHILSVQTHAQWESDSFK